MVQCLLWKGCGRWPSSSPVLFNNGKWSSSPRSGHSRVGSKNPLTAIGLDYGDHGAAHVPSPLGALESSFADVSRACVMFVCDFSRSGSGSLTAAVAAPRRFLLRDFVSFGSSENALSSAARPTRRVLPGSQKKIVSREVPESARDDLSPDALVHVPESTRSRARSQARFETRVRTLNTSVRHVPQAQRCLSRNATQFKGHATVGTKR